MDRSKFEQMMAASIKQVEDEIKKIEQNVQELKPSGGGSGGAGKLIHVEKPEDPNYFPGPRMQFGFDVVEAQRVALQPGDTLMITVKNDDLSQASVDALRMQLERVFPQNKVFIFAMGTSDDVKISIVSQTQTSYCSDCNCGKAEQAPIEDEHMKNLAKHAEGT